MYLQKINLKKKYALVTGAGKGLGRACSIALAEAGATVIALSRTQSDLNKLEKDIKKVKGKVIKIECDVMNYQDLREKLNKIKIIDILVNNAGTNIPEPFEKIKQSSMNYLIDLNLKAAFNVAQLVVKKMLKNKSGKIINITSVVGHTGNVGQANYTDSKAGIVAMSKSLAIEYAKKNINVNCISPGFISTAMTDKIDEKFKESIISKIPASRLGKPEDVANAVLFLASSGSDYINGETLHVNGGMYLG